VQQKLSDSKSARIQGQRRCSLHCGRVATTNEHGEDRRVGAKGMMELGRDM
jgi:hypothetical protein